MPVTDSAHLLLFNLILLWEIIQHLFQLTLKLELLWLIIQQAIPISMEIRASKQYSNCVSNSRLKELQLCSVNMDCLMNTKPFMILMTMSHTISETKLNDLMKCITIYWSSLHISDSSFMTSTRFLHLQLCDQVGGEASRISEHAMTSQGFN